MTDTLPLLSAYRYLKGIPCPECGETMRGGYVTSNADGREMATVKCECGCELTRPVKRMTRAH